MALDVGETSTREKETKLDSKGGIVSIRGETEGEMGKRFAG